MFTGARLSLGKFLSLTGESTFPDGKAGASSPFRASLTAIRFPVVAVSFSGPIIFEHSAIRAGGLWRPFETGAFLLFALLRVHDFGMAISIGNRFSS